MTSTRSGAGKAKPAAPKARRAKAEKPAAKPRKKRSSRTTLTWDGITMTIRYRPEYFPGYDHLEIQVTGPERTAPLPITETGYRSHFLRPGEIDAAGGPAAYVRRWLDEAARQPGWRTVRARWRQLSLF
jgi:hypothetical protein